MSMQFKNITPIPQLQNHIEKMWLFESSGKMPVDDMKLVVPNGNIKLTISYQNGIVAAINGKAFASKEQGCVKGWDQYFKGSLFKLLTTGKGQPT